MTIKLEASSDAETARRLQLKNFVSRQREFEIGIKRKQNLKIPRQQIKGTGCMAVEERLLV